MEAKPVFVLITARTCPHCHHFRRDWDRIRVELEKEGKVRIVDCEVGSLEDLPDPDIYPPDLALRWVRWYPMIMLFNGSSWDNALPTSGRDVSKAKLQGVIYNGQMDETKNEAIPVRGPQPTMEKVLHWIKKEIPKLKSKAYDGNSILNLLSAGSSIPTAPTSVSSTTSTTSPTTVIDYHPEFPHETQYIPTTGASVCRMKIRPKN